MILETNQGIVVAVRPSAELVHALRWLWGHRQRNGSAPLPDLAELVAHSRDACAMNELSSFSMADVGHIEANEGVVPALSTVMLTVSEAATVSGLSERTMRRRAANGCIPGAVARSSGWLIPACSIEPKENQ